ncbi:MAG: 4-hydroxy-tetrahydrodipicolinate synthase, partial [Planctomycetota bacterium]
RCGVMAGVSGMGTEEVAAQAEGLVSAGSEALLVAVPPYAKPPTAGLVDHFVKVAEVAGKTPLMLYNVPSRTGLDTPVKVYMEVAKKATNIVAVKETVEDVAKVSRIRLAVEGMAVLSGNDATALAMICLGAEGVVSVAANLVPQDMVSLVRAARSGDITTARKLHERLIPLFDTLFMETNPVPLKAALHIMALATDEVRPPLSPPCPDTIHTLQTVLLRLGLI